MNEAPDTGARIVRVTVHNFMGLEDISVDVPPAGAVVAGENGRGKTSLLKAIRAALEGVGVDPSAIRTGATKAEVLVDLDHISVRRVITAKSSRLSVLDRASDAEKRSPQAFLSELLGGAGVDPLSLWLEKDAKRRRAAILAAVPVAVTLAMLQRWCPGVTSAWVAQALGIVDRDGMVALFAAENVTLPGHGLEVIARVRAAYYAQRTRLNAEAAAREEDAKRAETSCEATSAGLLERSGLGALGGTEATLNADADASARALRAVEDEHAQALERKRAAAAWDKRAETSRKRIDTLRLLAKDSRAKAPMAPPPENVAALLEERAKLVLRRDELAEQLRKTNERLDENDRLEAAHDEAWAAAQAAHDLAESHDEQADELEAAIGERPESSQEQLDAIAGRLSQAAVSLQFAREAAALRTAREAAQGVRDQAARARAVAASVDAVVKRLTDDAPRELLASATTIPGLSVTEDDILLDGVSLDRLSGAERLKFAVDVARRCSKSKLLLVDGLEALDPTQLPAFIAAATAGGFQLIATRVAGGPPTLEPIEESMKGVV